MDRAGRISGRVNTDTSTEIRSEFERDLDRLIYTYHFRRLAEVTQVSSLVVSDPNEGFRQTALGHNRLTHSLKVGQVARRLSEYLLNDPANTTGIERAGGIDVNVVELAGRAHDIGHPPFGHVGEDVLDEFVRAKGLTDGFEGNAQTFRVLSSLASRHPVGAAAAVNGLDFTSASLAASVKYPWPRGTTPKTWRKFGYVEPDEEVFQKMVSTRLPENPTAGTLEAQIMDWADDITYAVHDIEDFYLAGLIPLDLLAHSSDNADPAVANYNAVNSEEVRAFWEYATLKLGIIGKPPPGDETRKLFESLASGFPRRRPDGGRSYAALVGRLGSRIITETSQATSVDAHGMLQVQNQVRGLVEVLKQLTWFYVIDRPELAAVQRGQRRILASVCESLLDWATEAFATSKQEQWKDGVRHLSDAEQLANQSTLPIPLREYILHLFKANNGSGAYEDPEANIVRGVVDFIASLRESEVLTWHERLGG